VRKDLAMTRLGPVKSWAGLIAILIVSGCATPSPPAGPWLDFATLQPGPAANRALACTPQLCRAAALRPAIALDASVGEVAAALARLEPRAEFLSEPAGDVRARYVAVTPVLRFRDDVDILIHAVSEGRVAVAVYSRSRIGLSDFGANNARISALERRLRTQLAR
jgi:uncharacterized protein (DUF1499 family)